MKNNYKVSVIIPCYNAEAFLDRCLGNLLDTDFNDIEIICVNDGSKDNTLKVLKGYAKKHKNIVIIDQKNQGQAVGRNNAVEKATGEYLCFVDSDDFTDPSMMQKMYEVAKKEKSEYVYCDYYEYYGKDNLKLVKNYIVDEPRKNALLANFAPWGKIYKTSFFKKHGFKFLPGKLFEDIAVVPIIASLAKNPVYLPEPLYYYNMENDSSIRRKTYNKKLEDIIYVADFLYEELKSHKLLEKYHDELEYMYLDSILKGGVLRFAAFEEGLEFIPVLREKVLNYFPNILKNKYSKKNSLYIKLLTYLSVKSSPKFLYKLKRIKKK